VSGWAWVALAIGGLWLLDVAAVFLWWWAVTRANRKFNRVRGRALAKFLAVNGGLR
jgi:hypothetical protein